MNLEEARKLLAALIFDDLDEASKTELMTYLQTDDELRERLADMRMAVKVTSDSVQHGPDPVLAKRRLKHLARLARHHRAWPVVFTVRRLAAVAAALAIIAVPCLIVLNRRDKAGPAFAMSDGESVAWSDVRSGPSYVYETPARKAADSGQRGAGTTFDMGYAYAPEGQVPTVLDEIAITNRLTSTDASVLAGDSSGGIANTPGGVLSGDVSLYAKDSPITMWYYNGLGVDAWGSEPYSGAGTGAYRWTGRPGVTSGYGGGMGMKGAGYRGYGGMGGYGGTAGYGMGGYGGYRGYDTGGYGRMRGGTDIQLGGETAGTQAQTDRNAGPSWVDTRFDDFIAAGEDADRRPVIVDDFGGVIAGTKPELVEPSKPVIPPSSTDIQYGLTSEGKVFAPQSVTMDMKSKEMLEQSLQQQRPALQSTHRRDEAVKLNVEPPGLEAHEILGKKMEPSVSTYNEIVSYGWSGKTMSEKGETRLFVQNGSKADVSEEAKVPPPGLEVTFSTRSAEHVGGRLPSINNLLEKVENDVGLEVSDRSYDWSVHFDSKEPVLVRTDPDDPSIATDTISGDPTGPVRGPVTGIKDGRTPILGDVPIVRGLFYADKEEEALLQEETRSKSERSEDDEAQFTEESARSELLTDLDLGSLASGRPAIDRSSVFDGEDETDLPPDSRFKLVPVNPWVMTGRDPLSTFALDVDTASYTLCRRYIRAGFLPPRGAVRMEEFVNYFNYHYPQRTNPTFTVHAEAAPSPFASKAENLTLLKIGVKARTIGRDQRKAAHLIFVVDASASMGQADRLPLVQQALDLLVDRLSPADRVSLITCANEARLHLEASPGRERDRIRHAIDAIQSSGPTNLLAGLKLGYAVARRSFAAKQINHVVLCSDGVANVGHTEAEAVLAEVAADRKQGITITCVGVGYGSYNDVFLEALANRGDGSYVFLDSAREAERVFVKQLAATLYTVAKDARIQVDFDPHRVRRYRLIGYENRDIEDKRFRDDTVDAGEVGSGQCSTALYELELIGQPSADGQEDLGTVFVRYRDVGTGQIEEISTRLNNAIVRRRTVESDPRFFLAAGAVRFAEILRQSEHAQHGKLMDVLRVVEQVSLALPLDRDVRELADLVRKAEHLPRSP